MTTPIPAFLFDAQPPQGWTLRDHLHSENGHKGLEAYLLELADKVKGFRRLYADPIFLSWFEVAASGAFSRSAKEGRIGTWRGHPVYVTRVLSDGMCHLTDDTGMVLAEFVLLNHELGKHEGGP